MPIPSPRFALLPLLAVSLAVAEAPAADPGESDTTSPAARAGDDEDAEEPDEPEEALEESGGLLGGLKLGLEADLELAYEDEGGEQAGEITFDEVGLSVEGAWWQTEMGIKYRSEGRKALVIEDAALQVGRAEGWPWFVTVGRTVLPFGQFDSPFAEDPMVTLAGETDDESVVLGFAGDRVEAATGIFRGDLAAGDGFDVVASATFAFRGGSSFGLSWTSDLSEATGLRELYQEGVEEGHVLAGEREGIPGIGAFATYDRRRWVLYLEGVSALASLPGGFLDAQRRQPLAWNVELWFRPATRWQIAGRVEGSHDLPENPARQYGAAVSRVLSKHLAATGEYLHGEAGPLAPSRNLVSAKLAFAF